MSAGFIKAFDWLI